MYRSSLLKWATKIHACELVLNHPRASFRLNVSGVELMSLSFMTAIDMGGPISHVPVVKGAGRAEH